MYKCMYVSEAGRIGGGEIGVGRGGGQDLFSRNRLKIISVFLNIFFIKAKKKGGMLPFVFHKATVPTISISIF